MTDAEKKSEDGKKGAGKVGGFIAGAVAKVRLAEKRMQAKYPERGQALDGIMPGEWEKDGFVDSTGYLPFNCPVRALGYQGENYFFVDTSGQVFNTGDSAMGVERLQKLFAGHEPFLEWGWPSYSKEGRVTGFKSEMIRRSLFAACRERGAWSMTDMVRGRGAWRDQEGKLILHCGDHMWIHSKREDTGEYGDYFYTRRPPSLSPWEKPVEGEDNPAPEIFRILRTWNFDRGDVDIMLLLGWIGIAMLGGALEWRPSIFVIGDAGTGKSELTGKFGLLRAVLGRMMITTTNASEAGLYSIVGHDSLPISIDEMEGEDNPEQAQKIIKMARDAASGSVRIRGSSNHKGVEFQAQSTFSFSGISPPPIPPASMSRLALIQLQPLKAKGAKAPTLSAAETVGPRILRRLADGWDELQYRLDDYYAILGEHGHDSRGQKTFGTFLAVAHMMLGDAGLKALDLPYEDLSQWGEWLRADDLAETEDKQPSWQKCMNMILTCVIDNYSGGQKRTIAQELARLKNAEDGATFTNTRERLEGADIALMGSVGDGLILAIPNKSKTLGRLLADTPYADRGGNGAWRFALRRGPEHVISKKIDCGGGRMDNRVTVAGRQERCTFVHLREYMKIDT